MIQMQRPSLMLWLLANELGFTKLNIMVGQDRLSEFQSLAHKYNGDLYEFEEIEVVSAGVETQM